MQLQYHIRMTAMHCRPLGVLMAMLCALGGSPVIGDQIRHGSEAFTEPYASIDIAASEPGRLTVVHIQRGDDVAAGSLLMELDTSVLEATRRVAAQRAENTARIEALRVDLVQKRRRHEALESLRRSGAASADELQSADTEMRIAELQVQAAEEEREQHELELREIEARIEQRRIRSPIAGVVTDLLREAGEFVSSSDPHVATLVDLSRLRATFYLPTPEALQLREGDAMVLQMIEREVDGRSLSMPGVIEHIAPLTQADSGRVRVDVVIDNGLGRYRSGIRCTLRSASQTASRSDDATDPAR